MSHVRTWTQGRTGRIRLERPEALNALTTGMCVAIADALLRWRDDAGVAHILIDGAGERAFCAGGDVVMLHDSGKARDGRAEAFWRTEYALNVLIRDYPKPFIALIRGIVMGGGVGLSVHGDFRVATPTTRFAMPETGIGYYPDVGGTWFLPRLDTEGAEGVGNWLGLTGAPLGPEACVALGIATHHVSGDRFDALADALAGSDDVSATLAAFHTPPASWAPPPALDAFRANSVSAILAELDGCDSDWAGVQATALRRKSPLALAATLEALRLGRETDSFRAAMDRELDISVNFLATQDFYEGIRAQLIDKDRTPQWSHAIGGVPPAHVARVLRPSTAPLEFFAQSGGDKSGD